MNYAYARVSAKDQNLQRQIAAFREFGIEKSRIFSEKKSGKDFERKEYKRLLKKLDCGDLLVIKSIDRLGRNYSQIIEEWNRITNSIGADILVSDMPLLDTRTKTDTLVGKFISDIVLQVLFFVAELSVFRNRFIRGLLPVLNRLAGVFRRLVPAQRASGCIFANRKICKRIVFL